MQESTTSEIIDDSTTTITFASRKCFALSELTCIEETDKNITATRCLNNLRSVVPFSLKRLAIPITAPTKKPDKTSHLVLALEVEDSYYFLQLRKIGIVFNSITQLFAVSNTSVIII